MLLILKVDCLDRQSTFLNAKPRDRPLSRPAPISRHVGIATRPVRIVADIVERLQLFRQPFDRDLTRKLVDDMAISWP